mmetsp:Transcript_9418/g.13812  ORF Transcript_9418/g.13812 Transcript_9418/m.13812 type:complete len:87 (-) Transcript_9418:733-993(-)
MGTNHQRNPNSTWREQPSSNIRIDWCKGLLRKAFPNRKKQQRVHTQKKTSKNNDSTTKRIERTSLPYTYYNTLTLNLFPHEHRIHG